MIQHLIMKSARRLRGERNTAVKMIAIYCEAHHRQVGGSLCAECDELQSYVFARLDRCPFGEGKPVCNKCPIHCYRKDRREQVKAVMRYSGPRMFFRHPILSAFHLIDAHREAPPIGRSAG